MDERTGQSGGVGMRVADTHSPAKVVVDQAACKAAARVARFHLAGSIVLSGALAGALLMRAHARGRLSLNIGLALVTLLAVMATTLALRFWPTRDEEAILRMAAIAGSAACEGEVDGGRLAVCASWFLKARLLRGRDGRFVIKSGGKLIHISRLGFDVEFLTSTRGGEVKAVRFVRDGYSFASPARRVRHRGTSK